MKKIYKQLNLTARSYHKILKVARTLADMDGTENILDAHLNEAVCYRNIDKDSGGFVMKYQYWLSNIPGVGCKTIHRLLGQAVLRKKFIF